MKNCTSEQSSGVGIVLAHRYLLLRHGIAELLGKEPGFRVVGDACDGPGLIEVFRRTTADIALVDLDLPGPDIERLLQEIGVVAPGTRIVLLGQLADPFLAMRLVAAGARGHVALDSAGSDLLSTIRSVLDSVDQVVISMTKRVLDGYPGSDATLSRREIEVLSMAAKGHTNAKIGTLLFITEGTVKRHLTNIYAKLDVDSRIQAINKAAALSMLENRTDEMNEVTVSHG